MEKKGKHIQELRLNSDIALKVAITFTYLSFLFTVLFDIPIARQILGFFFLTVVFGIVISCLLKLQLGIIERILFSIGLGIASLMGIGLLLNLLGPILSIARPLSLIPLLISISLITVLLLIPKWDFSERYSLSIRYGRQITFVGILVALLSISVIGTYLVNTTSQANNALLLMMLIFISLLVGVAVLARKFVTYDIYPSILFVVALALLLHVSLFSSYLHGGDLFGEYSEFKLTFENSYWDSKLSGRLHAMLSVTILPVIYSSLLGMDGTWLLKIVYPIVLALVPVALYRLFKSRISEEVAFFSVFFFVANNVFFFEVVELARQMIAEFFFVLLFLTIFNQKIHTSGKWICFLAFSFGLIVSHYALSYIFLAFIFIVWLLGFVRKSKGRITLGMVIMFGVMVFSWYIYVSSSSTFDALISMADNIRQNFVEDFLNPQSRGSQVLQGTGLQGLETFWHIVGRYIFYATEFFIAVGLIVSLIKMKARYFTDEYNTITFISMVLVVACIIVPNLASTFNMSRFYHVALFFLAPLCILGGVQLLSFLSRKKVNERNLRLILFLALIVPYFLFQNGFVYEISGEESWSLPLSGYRFDSIKLHASVGVVEEGEVLGAKWLSKYGEPGSVIYMDVTSKSIFSYSDLREGIMLPFLRILEGDSFVYLRSYNIEEGIVFLDYGLAGNVSEISLNDTDLIYSGSTCEIYSVP